MFYSFSSGKLEQTFCDKRLSVVWLAEWSNLLIRAANLNSIVTIGYFTYSEVPLEHSQFFPTSSKVHPIARLLGQGMGCISLVQTA